MEDFIPRENEAIIIQRKLMKESLEIAKQLDDLKKTGEEIPDGLEESLEERKKLLTNILAPRQGVN